MSKEYEVSYYSWNGEHGHAGQHSYLKDALDEAKQLYSREKKEGTLKEYGYIGVEGSDDFAIVYVTQEYLDRVMRKDAFKEESAYENWMGVAKEVLETGKPKKGNYSDTDEMEEGGLTPAKARQILHDGEIRGVDLTKKQRSYFGAVASGHARKYNKGGDVEWRDSSKKWLISREKISSDSSKDNPEIYAVTSMRNDLEKEYVVDNLSYAGFVDAVEISEKEYDNLKKILPYQLNKYAYVRPDGISISEVTAKGGWRIAKHLPHKTLIVIYSDKHYTLESALKNFESKYAEELSEYEKTKMEDGGSVSVLSDEIFWLITG